MYIGTRKHQPLPHTLALLGKKARDFPFTRAMTIIIKMRFIMIMLVYLVLYCFVFFVSISVAFGRCYRNSSGIEVSVGSSPEDNNKIATCVIIVSKSDIGVRRKASYAEFHFTS